MIWRRYLDDWHRTWRPFARDQRGTIAVMFALTFTAMIGLSALAIDYGTITRARSSYQAALEGALAASELHRELLDDDLLQFARANFVLNLDAKAQRSLREFSFTRDADGVRARATLAVATQLMRMFGVPAMQVKVSCGLAY